MKKIHLNKNILPSPYCLLKKKYLYSAALARVAELVDALDLGSSVLTDVRVRVSPFVRKKPGNLFYRAFFITDCIGG